MNQLLKRKELNRLFFIIVIIASYFIPASLLSLSLPTSLSLSYFLNNFKIKLLNRASKL